MYVWGYFAMFDLQSDKSLWHHSAHWQVNGWILLLSRDRGKSSQRTRKGHSAEGSTIMEPASVRGAGGLPSDKPLQGQTCQAQQKFRKVKATHQYNKDIFLNLFSPYPVFSLWWGSKPICRATQTPLCPSDSLNHAFLTFLYCKSCSGILLSLYSFSYTHISRNMRELSSSDLED